MANFSCENERLTFQEKHLLTLYDSEISPTVKQERKLEIFESKEWRKVFRPMRDDENGKWSKWEREEFQN
jgi:hypothetical protein